MELPKTTDEYTIYGAPNCEYCTKSKFILDTLNEKYIYRNIDEYNQPRKDTFDQLKNLKLIPENIKSIPIIFVYGKFIGGYIELNKYLDHKQSQSQSPSPPTSLSLITTDF